MRTSATAALIVEIPKILRKKSNENGLSFDELWSELENDKSISIYLKNDEGKNRLGLLQGISTRVKNNRISGISIIKTEDGNKWFAINDERLLKLSEFKRHMDVISDINFADKDAGDEDKLSKLDTEIGIKLGELSNLTEKVTKAIKEKPFEYSVSQKVTSKENKSNTKKDDA